jgi:hypothetical protein
VLNCAGFVLISQEAELEGRHENLRDSREVRRLQQRTSVPTSLSIKGDMHRLDLETFNPQLLSIYKVCYICFQSYTFFMCLFTVF